MREEAAGLLGSALKRWVGYGVGTALLVVASLAIVRFCSGMGEDVSAFMANTLLPQAFGRSVVEDVVIRSSLASVRYSWVAGVGVLACSCVEWLMLAAGRTGGKAWSVVAGPDAILAALPSMALLVECVTDTLPPCGVYVDFGAMVSGLPPTVASCLFFAFLVWLTTKRWCPDRTRGPLATLAASLGRVLVASAAPVGLLTMVAVTLVALAVETVAMIALFIAYLPQIILLSLQLSVAVVAVGVALSRSDWW